MQPLLPDQPPRLSPSSQSTMAGDARLGGPLLGHGQGRVDVQGAYAPVPKLLDLILGEGDELRDFSSKRAARPKNAQQLVRHR